MSAKTLLDFAMIWVIWAIVEVEIGPSGEGYPMLDLSILKEAFASRSIGALSMPPRKGKGV